MFNTKPAGHIAALITIVIWATTYVSTKVLLVSFKPVEILIFRFIMAYIALWIACPKNFKTKNFKQEVVFILAGLTGICLYYLLENIALTYTMASNVGVIVSVTPFFTALMSHIFLKDEGKLEWNFFIGFLLAIAGISLISFNGAELKLNPIGDCLALCASLVWSIYSVLTKKIAGLGYNVIMATRRTFFYGIIFMLPAVSLMGVDWSIERFYDKVNLFNILFLGLGASAMCFVTWSYAVKILGAMHTSIYIYMVPVITVVTSVIVLGEPVTRLAIIGTILTLTGLLISEHKFSLKRLYRILTKQPA